MCTSFVKHTGRTIIGMNFDADRELYPQNAGVKLVYRDNQFLVLVKVKDTYYPSFGCNRSGIFINTLMSEECETGKYRRGENVIHTTRLLDLLLGEEILLSDFSRYLGNHTIVNVPGFGVHCMVAGENGETFIVEPGRENLDGGEHKNDFAVLTNFPLSQNDLEDVSGVGSDRYRTAYERLAKHKGTLTVDEAFSVLEAVKQNGGQNPTTFSMVFVPKEEAVYFTSNGDFTKSFRFTFVDAQLNTLFGFGENSSFTLSGKGIPLSELSNW